MASSRLRAPIEPQQTPLAAVSFVMAKLGFDFKPKTFEALPNVVILEPNIDNEHPRSKCSTKTEYIYSAAIL